MSLRASQSILRNTVDGRNPANHLGCVKPCQWWDKLPVNWVDGCRISSNSMTIVVYVYIYIPRTPLTSFLGGWPSILWVKSSKIWVIWVLGTVYVICIWWIRRPVSLAMLKRKHSVRALSTPEHGVWTLSLHPTKVQRYFSKLNFQLWRHYHLFFPGKKLHKPNKRWRILHPESSKRILICHFQC